MKNHVKVKINGILNNSLFKITMIVLCCLILSTSIIRTDNFINCMFNGLVIFALLINIYHLPIVNDYIKKYKKKCGFIILLIACIVFGFWYYFQIGGLVGFTIICISFYLIIWGILNTYIGLTIFLYVGVHNFLCATHLCFVIIGQKVVILCQLAF